MTDSPAPTTTPAPPKEFSLTDPMGTWSPLHWTIAGMGVAILLLLSCLLWQNRGRIYASPPQQIPPQGEFGSSKEMLPLMMASCPPERRMELLSRFV